MSKSIIVKVPSGNSRIVAIEPSKGFSVVAHGKTASAVLAKARKAGAKRPSLMFVPKQGQRYVY
jgi:hypothetical protein